MRKVFITLKPFALAVCVLSISACQHTNVAEPSLNDTVSRNSVHMVRLPFEIKSEQDGTASLSNVTRASLNGFLTSIEVSYADVIMLDGPNAAPERLSAIEGFIRENGLIFAGNSALGVEPGAGSVMLYVERYVVTTPKCGNWAPENSNNSRNNASSFLGCSNTANLGLMAANPRDLIAGQSAGNSTAAAVGAIYTPRAKTTAGPTITYKLEGQTATGAQSGGKN